MPTIVDPNLVEKALFERLRVAAGLTAFLAQGDKSIFANEAPENEPRPFVIFSSQSDVPAYNQGGGVKAYDNLLYLVKGITEGGSSKQAGEIAREIDALLHNDTLTTDDGWTFRTWKESGVRYPETDGGVRYNHAGAIFRLFIP